MKNLFRFGSVSRSLAIAGVIWLNTSYGLQPQETRTSRFFVTGMTILWVGVVIGRISKEK